LANEPEPITSMKISLILVSPLLGKAIKRTWDTSPSSTVPPHCPFLKILAINDYTGGGYTSNCHFLVYPHTGDRYTFRVLPDDFTYQTGGFLITFESIRTHICETGRHSSEINILGKVLEIQKEEVVLLGDITEKLILNGWEYTKETF
jgi:hypothetical protein